MSDDLPTMFTNLIDEVPKLNLFNKFGDKAKSLPSFVANILKSLI